jgi:hypothetical protein
MTTLPETTQPEATTDLLASAVPIDLGAPAGGRVKVPNTSAEHVSVRRLVLRFALAGVPVLAAAIVITAIASVRIGTKLGIEDAKRVNAVSALLVTDHALEEGLVTGDTDAITKMDEFVHRYVLRGSLVLVKIHNDQGGILYSNEAKLIGQQFTLGEDERAVLAGQVDVEAEVSDSPRRRTLSRRRTACWRCTGASRRNRVCRCCSRRTSSTTTSATWAAMCGASSHPSRSAL